MGQDFIVRPIGFIRRADQTVWIELDPAYRDAMDGLAGFSHINVLFWFHENDHPEGRTTLKVHPCRDPAKPLTGVFATHSPLRPNLIGLSLCKITAIEGLCIHLDDIDARAETPVLDIKCFIPTSRPLDALRLPDWARELAPCKPG
jgi:tRNA-Thr(GGU) m(6)t(6)A37 methyltransferase TsaA